MKKTLLLFAAGLVAASANAQERMVNTMATAQQSEVNYDALKHILKTERNAKNTARKTTSATERWYSYVDYFDLNETTLSSSTALSAPYLWNDTMAVMAYSGTSGIEFQHNRTVSMGLVADPSYGHADLIGFNSLDYYPGEMKITPANAYKVDTIQFYGRYGFNPTKITVVDTLRVTFVYGDGASTADIYQANTTNPSVLANYGLGTTDTLKNNRMRYDPATNRAMGSTAVVTDILLDNSGSSPAWGDTLSNGTYVGTVVLPGGGVNVPAGNMIGASISFISGDLSFTPHDTVFSSTIGYKYNMFRPYVSYRGTSSTPVFASYSPLDRNNGMYKTLPDTALGWGGQYIPMWFWTSGGGASTIQYPYIDFHISDCPTCGIIEPVSVSGTVSKNITSVSAYPNPANNELSIPFTLATDAKVTVSLTNVVGQTVASQEFGKVSKGTAVFNTNSLAAGVYMYTLNANGQKNTGRVVIAH